MLVDIIDLINPNKIIAIGRVAEHSTTTMGITAEYARHPAQGGYKEFRQKMLELYV